MLTTPVRPTDVFSYAPLASGLDAWVLDFGASPPATRHGLVPHRVVVTVVLDGSYARICRVRGHKSYSPGDVAVSQPAEAFTDALAPVDGRGRIVGFELCERTFSALAALDGEVVLDEELARTELVPFASGVAESLLQGRGYDAAALVEALERVVARSKTVERDGVSTARLAMDARIESAEYVRHFAGHAGMTQLQFSRAFAQRYGMAPLRYRILRRLHEAARLLVLEARCTVPRAALAVGFGDVRFFKRCFRATLGCTPSAFRASLTAAAAAAA